MLRGLLILCALAALIACNSETAQTSPRLYPEMNSPQAGLYIEKCGECHAAPLPKAHTAAIWPGVLQRMQVRMTSKKVAPLNNEELVSILDYLQRHAAPNR